MSNEDKDLYQRNGMIHSAKKLWSELKEAVVMRIQDQYGAKLKATRDRRGKDRFLCMASSPEIGLDGMPVLEIASWAVRALGGRNIAGDAHDRFHKLLMDPNVMLNEVKGWRQAWQGKLEGFLECDNDEMDIEVTLFSLKGGFETDWERAYLLDQVPKVHSKRKIKVVCFENLNELLCHLEKLP